MPRARFSRLGVREHILAGNSVTDRIPPTPGDAPANPAEPPGGSWSLATYPYRPSPSNDTDPEPTPDVNDRQEP